MTYIETRSLVTYSGTRSLVTYIGTRSLMIRNALCLSDRS